MAGGETQRAVILLDWGRNRGHFPAMRKIYCSLFLQAGFEVHLIASSTGLQKEQLDTQFPQLAHRFFVHETAWTEAHRSSWSAIRNYFTATKSIKQVVKRHQLRAPACIFLTADYFVHPLKFHWLQGFAGTQLPASTVFIFHSLTFEKSTAKSRFPSFLKSSPIEFMRFLESSSGKKKVRRVAHLNESVALRLASTSNFRDRVIHLPDVQVFSKPNLEHPAIKEILHQSNGRPIISFIGPLLELRGVKEFLDLAKVARERDWFFLIAGELDNQRLSAPVTEELRDFKTRSKCFLWDQWIEDESFFSSIIKVSSAVVLVYQYLNASSAIPRFCAENRTPFLVAKGGVLEDRFRGTQMARAVTHGDIPEYIAALEQLLSATPAEKMARETDMEKYLSQQSAETLSERLLKAVGS